MNVHPLQPGSSGRHRRRRRHRSTRRLKVGLALALLVMVLAVVAIGIDAWIVEDGQRPAPAQGKRPFLSFFK